MEQEDIATLAWPARPPDSNPIEHCRGHLKSMIPTGDHAPTTIQQLADLLVAKWREIQIEFVHNFIDSVPRCVQAVIDARGTDVVLRH